MFANDIACASHHVRSSLLLHFAAVDLVVVAALGGDCRREVSMMRLGDITLRTSFAWFVVRKWRALF
jgi:hypothetical protein